MKTGYCFGCGRTGSEITSWMTYSHEERKQIMDGLEKRMETIEQKPRRETRRKRMARVKAQNTI
jgi:predicted Fe-S protein YdhL (DUF1289 family)